MVMRHRRTKRQCKDVTLKSSSRSPAAPASYEVTFVTPSELASLKDSIVMVLDEDIGVPRAINPFSVRIRSGGNGFITAAATSRWRIRTDPRKPTTITVTRHIHPGRKDQPFLPAPP